MSEQQPRDVDPVAVALESAVNQAVGAVVMLGVTAAIGWAITHRDAVWRARQRARRWWQQDDQRAGQRAAVADFRRALSAWEHQQREQAPARPRPRGLYER